MAIVCRDRCAAVERMADLGGRQRADGGGHQARAEVAVGRQLVCRLPDDRCDGRAGRRRWRSSSPPRRRLRRRSPAPSRRRRCRAKSCGRASRWWRCRAPDRRRDMTMRSARPWPVPAIAARHRLAAGEMDGDVAAIVDIGLVEAGRGTHRRHDLVGDRTGHRRHRRDEFRDGISAPPLPCARPSGRRSARACRRRPAAIRAARRPVPRGSSRSGRWPPHRPARRSARAPNASMIRSIGP